jgi:hypothetical protein
MKLRPCADTSRQPRAQTAASGFSIGHAQAKLSSSEGAGRQHLTVEWRWSDQAGTPKRHPPRLTLLRLLGSAVIEQLLTNIRILPSGAIPWTLLDWPTERIEDFCGAIGLAGTPRTPRIDNTPVTIALKDLLLSPGKATQATTPPQDLPPATAVDPIGARGHPGLCGETGYLGGRGDSGIHPYDYR